MVVAVAVSSKDLGQVRRRNRRRTIKSSNPRSQVVKNVVTGANTKTGTHPHRYTPAAAFGILWLAEILRILVLCTLQVFLN